MNWTTATTWAANLSYFDSVRGVTYTDWRLPFVTDTGVPGAQCTFNGTDCGYNVQTYDIGIGAVYSELAYMWYVNLDNKGLCDTSGNCPHPGWGPVDDPANANDESLFDNIQSDVYGSGTVYAPDPAIGAQDVNAQGSEFYAWAVRPGDVAAVPEPGSYALVLAGLGLMA